MEELKVECKVGHPAKISASEPCKQKTDRRDAALIRRLLVEGRFPKIWMPSVEQRDLRALLLHRHQWVRIRTRVQNALRAIALNQGLRMGTSLWSEAGQQALASLPLAEYSRERRDRLQQLYRQLQEQIDELDKVVSDLAHQRPRAPLLVTHPGVGRITGLATDVILGDVSRFEDGNAVASYVGIIPSEHSSGGRQRCGSLSKQGNPMLRFLWCEAVHHAAREDAGLKRFYRRKLLQKGLAKAKVATARKVGIRLYIMLREQIDYTEFCRRSSPRQKHGGAHAGMPEREHGPAFEQCLQRLSGFVEDMHALGRKPTARVIGKEIVTADATVAGQLALTKGERVIRIRRVRLVDGVPLSFDETYLPLDIGKKIITNNLVEPIFSLLERKYDVPLIVANTN
jgi:transposase